MRGGFGRSRYERPQPGLQIHSYEDALYPPRAYRYQMQPPLPPTTAVARGGAGGSNHGSLGGESPQSSAIVLPTIDADAACGPFLRGGAGSPASASASSVGYMGRGAASSMASTSTDATSGVYPADSERRPPPRLRFFLDCFVPDEDGSDVQSLSEVSRHNEPLNPFHYRELWGGMNGFVAPVAPVATVTAAVKAEPIGDEDAVNGEASAVDAKPESRIVKGEDPAKATTPAVARGTTKAAQNALQRTLRSLGLTEELSAMVQLAARVPAGGRLTHKQEKQLRLRPQRRPAPPRPIRRGAKVFMPATALLAAGGRGADMYGLGDVGATAATGGLIDVTAAGPRVMRVALAHMNQRGAFGTVGGGGGASSGGYPHDLCGVSMGSAGGGTAATGVRRPGPAVLDEFAFDDDDEEERIDGGGRRAGIKRGRLGEDGEADDGDVPLIASGRWGIIADVGGNVSGPDGAVVTAGAASAVAAAAQLDEEVEEDNDEEDDMSAGMAEDDDDDGNMGSDDGGGDNDSFGGGDDGGDDY